MNVAEYFRQPTENVGGFTTILSSFANLQIKHNYIQFSFEIPVSKRWQYPKVDSRLVIDRKSRTT